MKPPPRTRCREPRGEASRSLQTPLARASLRQSGESSAPRGIGNSARRLRYLQPVLPERREHRLSQWTSGSRPPTAGVGGKARRLLKRRTAELWSFRGAEWNSFARSGKTASAASGSGDVRRLQQLCRAFKRSSSTVCDKGRRPGRGACAPRPPPLSIGGVPCVGEACTFRHLSWPA